MRILVIGINYDPEIIATGVYTTGLAEFLAEAGDEVRVVTALPYYPAWRVFDGWRNGWWKSRSSSSRVNITHCPLYVPSNPTGAKRIVHHASFALFAAPVAWWHALTKRPDVVICIAPSMISAPIAWLSAKLCGAKSWLHIQDFEVEAAFATGLLSSNNLIGQMAQRFERVVLKLFDQISTISGPMIDKLAEKAVPQSKIYELRNWANIAKVQVVDGPSPMRAELGITTKYVALYSGNLANKQGLEIIPQMARQLVKRDDLTFVVCGDGPMRTALEQGAKDLGNIKFLPLQPLERLSYLLGMADIHLLPQIAGAADLVLPSKLTNMLASGRPVLATALADTALGKEVEGAGALCPPGDAIAASQTLLALLDDPVYRQQCGLIARNRAEERWSMVSILKKFRSQLASLGGK